MAAQQQTSPQFASDENHAVAANLREMADLLEQQMSDGFRVMAYRRAADTIAALDRPVGLILKKEGIEGLVALPAVGRSIAAAIDQMLHAGRWPQLQRLRGEVAPEKLFRTIPGIGPDLARRIHDALDVDSLEELEAAAHDGRLGRVAGFGPRRLAIVTATLAERLGRRRLPRSEPGVQPPVDLLLDVDREYREKAAAGALQLIAPRRFNPSGEAWLPVLHTRRDDWMLTALFSNTQRAHELGRTNDWVVIYFHTDSTAEGQVTVVTETTGPLRGRRVVRGRENECTGLR